jgi:hypothetical protein
VILVLDGSRQTINHGETNKDYIIMSNTNEKDNRSGQDRRSDERRRDEDRRNYSDVVDFERRHAESRREIPRREGPRRGS